jgi:hypothetical protein
MDFKGLKICDYSRTVPTDLLSVRCSFYFTLCPRHFTKGRGIDFSFGIRE